MCAIIIIQINMSWGSKVFYQKECKNYLWEIQIGELHDMGEFLKFGGDVRPEIRMCSQQGQAGEWTCLCIRSLRFQLLPVAWINK